MLLVPFCSMSLAQSNGNCVYQVRVGLPRKGKCRINWGRSLAWIELLQTLITSLVHIQPTIYVIFCVMVDGIMRLDSSSSLFVFMFFV
jgi:hypothetical protein